ncbi:MAG: hypothetical protein ACRC5M_03845 [Anaeroplasmataceae bacterium]
MNKTLVIYFSETNNIEKFLSNSEFKNIEKFRITTLKPLPKNMFLKMMIGGFKSLINAKYKTNTLDKNISDYSNIVLVAPIWNGKICPVPKHFLKNNKEIKNIHLLYMSGSGKTLKNFKLKNINVLSSLSIKQSNNNIEQVKTFIDNLK